MRCKQNILSSYALVISLCKVMHKIRGSARPPTRFLDMNDEIDLGHLKKMGETDAKCSG